MKQSELPEKNAKILTVMLMAPSAFNSRFKKTT